MKPQHFTAMLTVLAICGTSLAIAGDRHRCNSYRDKSPPELTSNAEQWVNAAGAKAVTLGSLRGKVVWLQFNFWENCTPMRQHLVGWHEQYADEGLVIVEVDGGRFESRESMGQCLAKKNVEHLVLWDGENLNHRRYGVSAWPTAYLIGHDGNVVWQGNPARIVNRPHKLTMLLCQIETELYLAQEAPESSALLVSLVEEEAAPANKEEPAVEQNVGDAAPDFEGTGDQGQAWKLSDHLGKKHVVVYFYPADFTLGCTQQAIGFRDNANALAEQGVEVIGISGDSVKNHALFKQTWELNFTLLADEQSEIATKFGVPTRNGGRAVARGPDRKPVLDDDGKPVRIERAATFGRWTFVVDPDGTIVYKNTQVRPADDSRQVLEFIDSRKTE